MNFDIIKKHPEFFTFIALFAVFYFIFFFGIGSYPLMDIDETRYASMAHDMFRSKDFMTLYLNGDFFFEKPPLFFWLECLSFNLFGHVSEFTVRFPVALLGCLTSFLVYFVGKKVVSRTYGIISSLILATSAEFFILAKFAILDIVLAACVAFSIFFGFMTHFCDEKNQKYFWWLFYIFSALAVLAKGIPGFVLPFGTMFFVAIFSKKFKNLFKPIFIIPGFLLFFLIVLPWHFIMLDKHDPLFFNEYIIKHHLHRFTDSADLGRKEPFCFFLLVILWGFFPWIVPAISTIKTWGAKLTTFIKNKCVLLNEDNQQKYILFNVIATLVTLIFFSISSSKLVTYILPIYPFLASLLAFIFIKYLKSEEYQKSINISSVIFGIFLTLTGFVASFIKLFLQAEIYKDIAIASPFAQILFMTVGITLIVSASKNFKKTVFSTYVIFMLLLSAIAIPIGFKIDYNFGQNDLIKYASQAKDNGETLASFGFGRRFSLNYYYQNHVIYEQLPVYENLNKLLNDKNTVVIIKNKDLPTIQDNAKFTIIEQGVKYTLIKG